MQTAIGVFTSHDQARSAVQHLLAQSVPAASISFLSRSEYEANAVAIHLSTFPDVPDIANAQAFRTSLVPGVGQVFLAGIGASALLAPAGAAAPSAADLAFFHDILREGRSLIVVPTPSPDLAARACRVLDAFGFAMQNRTPLRLASSIRRIGNAAVLKIKGRITLCEGTVELREMVRELADKGSGKIILNLEDVKYVDSCGIGELVKTHTTLCNRGGQLRLVHLNPRVHHLLQLTKVSTVLNIDPDETAALRFLNEGHPASVMSLAAND